MSKKATHRGTCQVCGCIQKLPGGFLSLHGYTVNWGFFSGVCHGAGFLPFEQDKGLVEGAIARALEQEREIKAKQARLREPVAQGTTKTFVNVFFGSTRLGPDYRWKEVELYAKENVNRAGEADEYRWTTYHYPAPEGTEKRGHGDPERYRQVGDYGTKSIEEAVAGCNEAYAKSMDKPLEQITQYVAWQRKRIKDWKVQPLLPLKK
jgi:hypothetical protein